MIRHAGHALLLRLARARTLDSYLNDETPFLLRKKLVKKSCAALEGREESDPQWEDVARRVNEAVGSLAEMLTADAAPLSAVEKAMDRVSVLLNKFVPLPEESHAPLLVVVAQLLRHLHGFSGAGAETTWSQQLKADGSEASSFFAASTRLMLGLLSTYTRNEDFSDLFEGDVWAILMVLTPLSILSDVDARTVLSAPFP